MFHQALASVVGRFEHRGNGSYLLARFRGSRRPHFVLTFLCKCPNALDIADRADSQSGQYCPAQVFGCCLDRSFGPTALQISSSILISEVPRETWIDSLKKLNLNATICSTNTAEGWCRSCLAGGQILISHPLWSKCDLCNCGQLEIEVSQIGKFRLPPLSYLGRIWKLFVTDSRLKVNARPHPSACWPNICPRSSAHSHKSLKPRHHALGNPR